MPGPWGKAIEEIRQRLRLTKAKAAERSHMTATTYGRIEKGGHTRTRKLRDIADGFGVSIEEVLISRRDLAATGAGATFRDLVQREIRAYAAAQHIEPTTELEQVEALANQIDPGPPKRTKHVQRRGHRVKRP